jgi:hypothetical protein
VLRSDSFYKGELGMALLAAELNRLEFTAVPFFELLRTPLRRGLIRSGHYGAKLLEETIAVFVHERFDSFG